MEKKTISIRSKLIYVFSVILTVMAVIVILCITGYGNVAEKYEKAYTEYSRVSENAALASSYMYRATSDIELVMVADGLEAAMVNVNNAKTNIEASLEYMSTVENTLKDETIKKLYNTANDAIYTYKAALDEALVPVLAGDLEGSVTMMIANSARYSALRAVADDALDALCTRLISEGDTHVDAAGYKNHFTTGIMILILVIVVIFGIVAAVVMIRQIKMPLLTLTEIADRMALGEADVEINKIRDDEIGKLSDSMKRMIENIKMQNAAAQEIAVGNLQIEVKTASEKDILSHTLKKLVADNNEALGSMKEATLQVASGAEEVASASQSLAQGSTEQASAIQQITASIDEIANRTKVNAQDANEANKLVESAKSGAVRGNERMNEMIKAMEEINESSFNISKIMKVIDDIAFQTNILALNAAVEAARAGQHGKGFAVVADEVRSLAGKSAQAASETAELIEDSIKKVGNGSKLAEETAAALNEIVQAIDKIVALTSSIASASNEQATAVTQIDQAISQVSQVVQTNSSTSEECAAASEQLSAQAEKLKEMIGKYRLKEAGYGRDYYSSSHTGSNTSRPGQKLSGYLEAAETPVISLEDGFGKY